MDKILNVTFASSLTNLCEINSSFDTGVLRICYTGDNRNGSNLSRSVIEQNLPTIYNCPIVCNYDRETNSLGSHDIEFVRNDDGSMKMVNITQPVGVIPESARVWFENYREEDGTVHEYLYSEVLLWKRQEAYEKIKEDGITAHSMEIAVKDGKKVNGVYQINDFEFTAFCLLGSAEPCFESSELQMFAYDDFKQQLNEMMQELKDSKEIFTKVDHSTENNEVKDIDTNNVTGGETAMDEKMELAAKYDIDVDALDFSLDDFTLEELKEKFEAMSNAEPDEPTEPVGPGPADEGAGGEDFALTMNVVDEIQNSLYSETIQSEWGESPRYLFVDCDMDLNEVYCWDRTDWLLYGFKYAANGDKMEVDFSSKKRMKYAIVEFDEGEQTSPFAETYAKMFELITAKTDEITKSNAAYQAIEADLSNANNELKTLREFKINIENEEAKAERNELFARFEDLNGVEEFETLKENCTDMELDAIEEKCFAIRGKNVSTQGMTFSKHTGLKMHVDNNDHDEDPYGGLFAQYRYTGS